MTAFLSNVFNDPSNAWYYVVGVLFLLLIFAALAVYVILSNKKNKKNGESDEPPKLSNETDNEVAQTTAADRSEIGETDDEKTE